MGQKRNKKDQNSNTKKQTVEVNEVPPQSVVEKKTKTSKKIKQEEPEEIVDEVPPIQKERKKRSKKAKRRANTKNNQTDNEEHIEEPTEDLHDNVAAEIEQHEQENSKSKKNNNVDEVVVFPTQDLSELFRRMAAVIPDNDSSVYSTRLDKLNWDDISFKNYTAEECKSQWLIVQKKVRKYRLLSEMVQSAKELIRKPWTNFYTGQKNKRHPDMPRRPLSSFMLFYLHKRDKIRAENPGLEVTEITKIVTQMYRALSPSTREKYVKEALEKRKTYDAEMEEFYRQHPEISPNTDKQNMHKNLEVGPKRPNTPFALFYESQLKTIDKMSYIDKHKEFKDHCKEQWKNMSDKKKVIWINWSLDEETKYYDELKIYITQNPDFVPPPKKSVLTKEEKILKERLEGKPVKPPNSAYSLYSRMMLQSNEIKNITPKDRMVYIADKWKNCTEQEKKDYSERIVHLREQYKLDFASYLESLPEEKRQEEIRSTMPKRKRSPSKAEEVLVGKKKKVESDIAENSSNNKVNKKGKDNKSLAKDNGKKKPKKETPFAKPPYWHRMKKEEKRTFNNAMLKLKVHLASRFEKYINNRESVTSGDEDDEETNESEASDSSSEETS